MVTVSTAALLTLSTGIVMVERFEGVGEAAEAVMGHPVWTHEFPSLGDRMRELIVAQLPDFPTEVSGDWREVREAAVARYGETIEIDRGNEQRAGDPVSTLVSAVAQAKGRRAHLLEQEPK